MQFCFKICIRLRQITVPATVLPRRDTLFATNFALGGSRGASSVALKGTQLNALKDVSHVTAATGHCTLVEQK